MAQNFPLAIALFSFVVAVFLSGMMWVYLDTQKSLRVGQRKRQTIDAGLLRLALAEKIVAKPPIDSNFTTLHNAVKIGDVALLETLIVDKTRIEAKTDQGHTPLHIGILSGQSEAVKILYDAEADITAEDNDGNTALHLAAFACQTRAISTLLAAGANPRAADNYGNWPIDYADAENMEMNDVYWALHDATYRQKAELP